MAFATWGLLAALFTVASLTFAFETAMHFRGSAIDGPFQLYNALRRIRTGFHPGVDFQYFHGLGLPYLYYGAFRLFGEGLRGSELSRELITAACYPLLFLAVFRAFVGDGTKALCLTVAAFAASYLLKMSPVIFAVNGMLGVRSAVPTLLPAVLYLIHDGRKRSITAGLLIGLSLFLSTEQGLAVLLAYMILSAVAIAAKSDRKRQAIHALVAVGLAAVTLVALLTCVAGWSGMRGALRYNFRLVPMDQYWYFGAPPNTFVPSWSQGLQMVIRTPAIAIALAGAMIACAIYLRAYWRSNDEESSQRTFAFALLSVYALVSCSSLLGVFTPSYVQPCRRILLIIVMIEWTRYATRVDTARVRASWLGVPSTVAVLAGVLSAGAFVGVSLIPATLEISLPHVVGEHGFGDARFSIDGIWPETLQEAQAAIDAHRTPDGKLPVLWSTYAGWIEARNGIFHPNTDYIIHALGPELRAEYTDRFEQLKPTLVQTVRPAYSQYEAWIENNHWAFYEALLRSYRVYTQTPWSIFWERRPTAAPEPAIVATISVQAGHSSVSIALPPSTRPVDLYDVEIEYTTHNPFAKLPVVGAMPRYLVGFSGTANHVEVSMDPHASTKRFPMLARGGTTVSLGFATFSLLPGASWQPRAVRVRRIDVDSAIQPWFDDLMLRTTSRPVQ